MHMPTHFYSCIAVNLIQSFLFLKCVCIFGPHVLCIRLKPWSLIDCLKHCVYQISYFPHGKHGKIHQVFFGKEHAIIYAPTILLLIWDQYSELSRSNIAITRKATIFVARCCHCIIDLLWAWGYYQIIITNDCSPCWEWIMSLIRLLACICSAVVKGVPDLPTYCRICEVHWNFLNLLKNYLYCAFLEICMLLCVQIRSLLCCIWRTSPCTLHILQHGVTNDNHCTSSGTL